MVSQNYRQSLQENRGEEKDTNAPQPWNEDRSKPQVSAVISQSYWSISSRTCPGHHKGIIVGPKQVNRPFSKGLIHQKRLDKLPPLTASNPWASNQEGLQFQLLMKRASNKQVHLTQDAKTAEVTGTGVVNLHLHILTCPTQEHRQSYTDQQQ